jgi:hypothetical protein
MSGRYTKVFCRNKLQQLNATLYGQAAAPFIYPTFGEENCFALADACRQGLDPKKDNPGVFRLTEGATPNTHALQKWCRAAQCWDNICVGTVRMVGKVLVALLAVEELSRADKGV